ncbi:UNVERIFIED_CONTAM: hypothetical protein Sradi_7005100 [Sesamum radiatum]|uniref:Uncharacterized protein n=1 Tax=Sesamum radiatum TaxID=300843 RepID=A0AAW2JCI1_SESRA
MDEFQECILETGLITLPMQGEVFTWHNCSSDNKSLWKRLDVMLVSDYWLGRWSNASYVNLTLWTSDHSLLVIHGDTQTRQDHIAAMYAVTRKLKVLKPVFRQQRRHKGDLSLNVKLVATLLESAQKLLNADHHNSVLLQLEQCCRLAL